MIKQFIQGELHTKEDHVINSLIMGQADEIASQLTEFECKANNIQCYNETIEDGVIIQSFTDEAQDVFDVYYDQYTAELYTLFNQQLSAIQ